MCQQLRKELSHHNREMMLTFCQREKLQRSWWLSFIASQKQQIAIINARRNKTYLYGQKVGNSVRGAVSALISLGRHSSHQGRRKDNYLQKVRLSFVKVRQMPRFEITSAKRYSHTRHRISSPKGERFLQSECQITLRERSACSLIMRWSATFKQLRPPIVDFIVRRRILTYNSTKSQFLGWINVSRGKICPHSFTQQQNWDVIITFISEGGLPLSFQS